MKLYNDQRNAQVFSFICLFPSALHVSGFLLAHLQRQQRFKSAEYGVRAWNIWDPDKCEGEASEMWAQYNWA
jgi:hypothetical protein